MRQPGIKKLGDVGGGDTRYDCTTVALLGHPPCAEEALLSGGGGQCNRQTLSLIGARDRLKSDVGGLIRGYTLIYIYTVYIQHLLYIVLCILNIRRKYKLGLYGGNTASDGVPAVSGQEIANQTVNSPISANQQPDHHGLYMITTVIGFTQADHSQQQKTLEDYLKLNFLKQPITAVFRCLTSIQSRLAASARSVPLVCAFLPD